MISTYHTRQNNIAILIGPGFAESDVVYCLSKMRTAGLPVSLIGVSKYPISSQHGLQVSPDYSFNDLDKKMFFQQIIIPGSYESVTSLLSTPDFHSLIKEYNNRNSFFVILKEAETALQQANLFLEESDNVLRQAEQPLDAFCRELIQLVRVH